MASLVLEGGSFRTAFSCGVMDALLDNDIMLPYVIGVSAGISNGLSYVSKQPKRSIDVFLKYRNDKRYVGKRNILKSKSIFGLDFVFDEVPNKLIPYDYEALNKYEGKILVGTTNALTGNEEFFDAKKVDKECTMFRATCAVPIIVPAIKINGVPYYDGGVADPIPVDKAISDGNDKHIIVLTRTKEYRKTLDKSAKIASKVLKSKYPKLSGVILNRHIKYNERVKFCEQLEEQGKAIILRPNEELKSLESDVNVLEKTYKEGYDLTISKINLIKNFI